MIPKWHKDGFEKSGKFTLSNGQIVDGIIELNGQDTKLELYSDERFDAMSSPDIHGRLFNHTDVSLLDCITAGIGHGGAPEKGYHFSSIFPHFVVVGGHHISSSSRIIRSISFTTDDAIKIFRDFDVFGSVIGEPKKHLQAIISDLEHDREVEIGDHPQIFYYTGKREIFKAETSFGMVSAEHCFGGGIPGTAGINFKNEVRVRVDFHKEQMLSEAIDHTMDLLRFLELIAGRRQCVSDFSFNTADEGSRPEVFDVYWSYAPTRSEHIETESPHFVDLLIQPSEKPNQFAYILKNWLGNNSENLSARVRFSTAFSQGNQYSIDRLVGIANAFDILPLETFDENASLNEDLEDALEETKRRLQKLPQCPERDSILGAIGRVKKPFLKTKIRHQAKKLLEYTGERFTNLLEVTDEAVNCRNFYVHGTESKIDYEENSWLRSFFTDTLEFVFATTDLIDCGWDINAWFKQGSVGTHPFGTYSVNFNLRMKEFRSIFREDIR